MNVWEQIWYVLAEKMSFETFTPIRSHVNENRPCVAQWLERPLGVREPGGRGSIPDRVTPKT